MKKAVALAYCRITPADFFSISKPSDHYVDGGGQSYIDFAGTGLPQTAWDDFFADAARLTSANGWGVEILSVGTAYQRTIEVSWRAARNLCIRSQKIHSKKANRVEAWHPAHSSFPDLPIGATSSADPRVVGLTEDLVIYIIKAADKSYWAGFIHLSNPVAATATQLPGNLFTEGEGIITFTHEVDFDETNSLWPFVAGGVVPKPPVLPSKLGSSPTTAQRAAKKPPQKSEADLIDELFNDDVVAETAELRTVTRQVRVRNQKAARSLKALYGQCQITGDEYTFLQSNGKPYLEVHHLIPLGRGGSDSPENLVVLSAHMHRMLHYADVSDIDFTMIKDGKLPIKINGKDYTITWHPSHAKIIGTTEESD